jgi:hypothetical protein
MEMPAQGGLEIYGMQLIAASMKVCAAFALMALP